MSDALVNKDLWKKAEVEAQQNLRETSIALNDAKANAEHWKKRYDESETVCKAKDERNAFLERENAHLKEARTALRACLKVIL